MPHTDYNFGKYLNPNFKNPKVKRKTNKAVSHHVQYLL